jgi:hypothetical protein
LADNHFSISLTALVVVSATRQKNVRQKNGVPYFSVLHFSVWLVSVAELVIETSLTEAQWEKLCKA